MSDDFHAQIASGAMGGSSNPTSSLAQPSADPNTLGGNMGMGAEMPSLGDTIAMPFEAKPDAMFAKMAMPNPTQVLSEAADHLGTPHAKGEIGPLNNLAAGEYQNMSAGNLAGSELKMGNLGPNHGGEGEGR